MEAKKTEEKTDTGWDTVCGGENPGFVPELGRDGKPISKDQKTVKKAKIKKDKTHIK